MANQFRLANSSSENNASSQVAIFNLFYLTTGLAKCPPVKQPCYCSSTAMEPVSIVCHNAGSLPDALAALSIVGNVQIDTLAILNTPIDKLPQAAFGNLIIVRLVLNHNGLKSIHPEAFGETMLNSVLDLDLRHNSLGHVPYDDGVSRLRRLTKLNLAYNRINEVAPWSFKDYASANYLSRLDLSGNGLYELADHALDGLNALEDVSLEVNSFQSIPANALVGHRLRMKNLNLGVNQISTVAKGALDLPNLQSLSLEYNNIGALEGHSLAGVPNLLYLYLTGNKLTEWNCEIFRPVPNLRALGMGEMAVTRIPTDAFKHIVNLLRLEMNEAAVETIGLGAFQRIPRVQAISLHKNLIASVRADTFRGLSHLQALDLSNNGLKSVEDGAWAHLPSLRNLDISNNHLRTLHAATFNGTFLKSNDASVLYLCNNPWMCSSQLDWFRQWLRSNRHIAIDKADCLSVCRGPDHLVDWPLRGDDLVGPTPQPIGPHPDSALGLSSISWIILAIILAILLTSICLLALVRYFVSKRHKELKDEAEDRRVLSSTASGYQANAPSGYPAASVLDVNLPPVDQSNQWTY